MVRRRAILRHSQLGRLLPAALALLLVACASQPPQGDADWVLIDEARLTQGEREGIQESLVWLGYYDSLIDGVFSNRTRNAIKTFQRSLDAEPTGRLSHEQLDALWIEGHQARVRYAPVEHIDLSADYSIVYPSAIVAPAASAADGARRFESGDGTVTLEISAFATSGVRQFRHLYDDEKQASAVRTIRYKAYRDTWFVVSGLEGENAFYTRAITYDGRIIRFRYTFPLARRAQLERLSIVLANTFRPRTTLATAEINDPSIFPPTFAAAEAQAVTDRQTLPTAQELFAKVNQAVYMLVDARGSEPAPLGAAVAIDAHRLLTACHVLDGKREVFLDRDGRLTSVRLTIEDAERDLCVLHSLGGGLHHIDGVRSGDSIRVGEQAYAIGAPFGFDRTLSDGLVSRMPIENGSSYIQLSAPTFKGSSGGGVFDARGCLMGIMRFRIEEHEAFGFAIPVGDVFTAAERDRLPNPHCR